VTDRIDSIWSVATALFEEWDAEIETMSSPDLKGKSRVLLEDTRTRYAGLIAKVQSAESQMAPVPAAFKDHVTFLERNLNAQAISALKDTVIGIEADVEKLIEEMQVLIDEADEFIAGMSQCVPAPECGDPCRDGHRRRRAIGLELARNGPKWPVLGPNGAKRGQNGPFLGEVWRLAGAAPCP